MKFPIDMNLSPLWGHSRQSATCPRRIPRFSAFAVYPPGVCHAPVAVVANGSYTDARFAKRRSTMPIRDWLAESGSKYPGKASRNAGAANRPAISSRTYGRRSGAPARTSATSVTRPSSNETKSSKS